MLLTIKRTKAYKLLRDVPKECSPNEIDFKIAVKFSKFTAGQLVDQLQSRRDIDDQRREMHRRCAIVGLSFYFDQGDKVQFRIAE